MQELITYFESKSDDVPILFREFANLVKGLIFLKKVLERNLIIPMFEIFSENYEKVYREIKEDSNLEYSWGEVATYIPPLALADPEWFATSFCSTDDQLT